MRVVLSTWGRFHVFYLARQLERFGWLTGVFVPYARFLLRNEGIAAEKLYTNPWLNVPLLAKWRMGIFNDRIDREWVKLVDRSHNRFIERNIPPCDVLIALSGSGLGGGGIVQERGGVWICNRSAAHQVYSDRLLTEEHARYGIRFRGADPWAVEKELREYEACDRIVVPSEYARQSFVAMGVDPRRVVKISFGGDLASFSRSRDRDPDHFVVLYCGGVTFRKGIPYLLEAFRRLKHPKKRLIIAGGISPTIKPYLARSYLEGVEFVGIANRTQLRELYSRAHVFTIASLDEGMAKVQTEAMCCGTPVIATDHCGGTDVIRDGLDGYIVPIRSPEVIADRLQRLADDPLLCRQLGENALARIRDLQGWDRYGDQYRALLLSLVGRRPSNDEPPSRPGVPQ